MDDAQNGLRTTPTLRENPLLDFAREHVTLLVSIVGAIVFAIRCIVVSGNDIYVATALLAETSVGDAVRALLFTLLPILIVLLFFGTSFAASTRIIKGRWRDWMTLGLALIGPILWLGGHSLFGGFQEPISLLVAASYALFPLLIFIVVQLILKVRRLLVRWALLALTIAFMLLSYLDIPQALAGAFAGKTFWLPPERIVFQNEAPFTGYVLKVNEDYLVILYDEPRIIIERKKTTLDDRDFCYPEDHKARSSKLASDAPVCP
jgi:hypothetical protein